MAYANALAALADPTRRTVLERLRSGAKPVGEIAMHLPVSRPAVSQHLKVRKEAGLVRDRRRGTQHIYEIDPEGLGPLRAWLTNCGTQVLPRSKPKPKNPKRKRNSDECSREDHARAGAQIDSRERIADPRLRSLYGAVQQLVAANASHRRWRDEESDRRAARRWALV